MEKITMGTMTIKGKTMRSVDVDWNEFYYTNCPLVSPSNVDQEIGWVREEFKKIGVTYRFLRSTRENDWSIPRLAHEFRIGYRRLRSSLGGNLLNSFRSIPLGIITALFFNPRDK